MDGLPPHLVEEREALVGEIHEAFRGVSREGGVSWSESEVVDDYGSPEERQAARARDRDRSWPSLVDDPEWDPGMGVGGWSFLDAIGFRYYLPAAMIRCVRSGYDEGIQFHLTLATDSFRDWHLAKWSLLDARQKQCVKRFLRYMLAVTQNTEMEIDAEGWWEALKSYWEAVGRTG